MANPNVTVTLTAVDNLSSALKNVANNAQQAANQVQKSISGVNGALDKFRTQVLGAFVVSGLFDTIDALQTMQNKLRGTTQSADEFNRAMTDVNKISTETGMAMTDVANLFSKISANSRQFGFDMDDITTTTYAFANALRASGAGAQGAASAMYQFGQIMNKGKADGDELKTVMENLSGPVLSMLASKLGLTVAEMLKLRSEGKLTAEMVATAFKSSAKELEQMTSQMPLTVGQSLNQVKNSFANLLLSMEQSVGMFSKISAGLQWLAENFTSVAKTIAIVAGAWAGMKMAAWAGIAISAAQGLLKLGQAMRQVGVWTAIAQGIASKGKGVIGAIAGAGVAAIATEQIFKSADEAAKELEKSMSELATESEGAAGSLSYLGEAQEGLGDVENIVKEREKFIQKLREEAAEARMTAEELQTLKLIQFAATIEDPTQRDAYIKEGEDLIALASAQKKSNEAKKEAAQAYKQAATERKNFLKDLDKEIALVGKTNTEQKLYEAQQMALTIGNKKQRESWLALAEAKIKALAAAEEEFKKKEEMIAQAKQMADTITGVAVELQKEIDGYNELGRSAQLAYDLEKGRYRDASEQQKELLRLLDEERASRELINEQLRIGREIMDQFATSVANQEYLNTASREYLEILQQQGTEAADVFQKQREPVDALRLEINAAEVAVKSLQAEIDRLSATDESRAENSYKIKDLQDQQLKLAGEIATKYEAIAAATNEFAEANQAAHEAQQQIAKETEAWKSIIQKNRDEWKKIEDELALVKKWHEEGKISADEYRIAVEKINKVKLDKIRDEMTETQKAAVRIAEEMQSAFEDFFFDAMQGEFGNLADSFKKMIDRMVAEALAAKLANALFGDFKTQGRTGGGMLGGLLEGIAGFFGFGKQSTNQSRLGTGAGGIVDAITGIFKAQGGPVSANSPYVVGEIGPELFIPKTSGTIIPADVTQGLMSSGNSLTVNITAMDSKDVLRAMDQIKRPLAEMLNGTNRSYNLGAR